MTIRRKIPDIGRGDLLDPFLDRLAQEADTHACLDHFRKQHPFHCGELFNFSSFRQCNGERDKYLRPGYSFQPGGNSQSIACARDHRGGHHLRRINRDNLLNCLRDDKLCLDDFSRG